MEVQSEDCREKGNQCMKEEKYIEAMLHYTHGIKRDPRNAYLYSNRSLALLRMQQYYYALQDAETTIRLMPKWTKGYYRKGEIESATEHYKDAIESYKQGLQLKLDDISLKEAVAKATHLYQMQLQFDSRLVWYGAALGALVGVLLVVSDEAVAKQPLLQNDVVRAGVLVSLCLVCCALAVLYRMMLRSQRSSLLERPPDLFADSDLLSTTNTHHHPSSSTSSSSSQQSAAEAGDGQVKTAHKPSTRHHIERGY